MKKYSLNYFFPLFPEAAREKVEEEYIKADRVMLVLLVVQWFVATFITSMLYETYLLGFIGGGLVVGMSYVTYLFYRGTRTMRFVVASALMLFSLIYIQQYFGRIEMHFHVFIAIAFLTLYKDIYPPIIAAIVTTLHHLIFNYLQLYGVHVFDMPVMVFNYGCGLDIVFLHAVFVVIEVFIIGYIIKVQIEQSTAMFLSKESIKKLNRELEHENFRNKKLAKEFEQFAHALDESAIVSKTDLEGNITYVNDMFCEISGYTREELIGKPHNIMRHPDVPSEVFRRLWATIQDKRIFKGTLKNRKKDGSSFYAESIVIPLLDLDGDIVEYLGVRYDVTEIVHSRDKALAAEKAKDRFLSNMSHELRTPLNAIMGFTQIAQSKNRDETMARYLDVTLESSKTLLKLINDILDISKLQSGKFSYDPVPFNLKRELKTLLGTFESLIKAKEIVFVHECDDSLDQMLVGDWMRISQVITNLVGNAVKFTPDKGRVSVTATYRDKNFVCCVSDTGIGLSDEAKKRIFDPFEQADDSTTRRYGGTGLGLSISSDLIRMMEGRLEVKSSEGEGSSFTLYIPLVPYTKERSVEDVIEASLKTQEPKRLCGHVLIAEDDYLNREFIKTVLHNMGLTSDIALDGQEALDMYGKVHYDLVLMDESMPYHSGTEVMKMIREKYEEVAPIIVVTANVMRGERERFLAEGMDDFVGKPIDFETLYGVLKKYLKPLPETS